MPNLKLSRQAGWRDKQDLVGHYNSFEKMYHESKFLQAVYRAGCPTFIDRPFILILDEMNLSHPEQYFAEILSTIEQSESEQYINLMTHPIESPPRLMEFSGGKMLRIPSNLWFVGTANHDETTMDFAPKTYDRSHVMEMPRNRDNFKPVNVEERIISLDSLKAAFQEAHKKHANKADDANKLLQNQVGKFFQERFKKGGETASKTR